jgi:hypothetical protein
MKKFKLTNKRRKALSTIKYFIPKLDYDLKCGGSYNTYIKGVKQSEDGMDPVEAFFRMTDEGYKVEVVNDLEEFTRLVVGHRRMTLTVGSWIEGVGDITVFDFEDEPKEIGELWIKTLSSEQSKVWAREHLREYNEAKNDPNRS